MKRPAERSTPFISASSENSPMLASALIESSVDGILAFDHECRYTVWNPAMERISGVAAGDALGQYAFELFPFLKQTGEDRFFYTALEGNPVVARDRSYVVPATGRQGFFEGHYSPLRGARGEIIGGLAIIRDITERKQAEEAAERQRQDQAMREQAESLRMHARVLESMNEGVSLSDENGIILYTNPAEDRMFGYEPGELIGQHVTVQNAYPPEENERIVAGVIEDLKRDGAWVGEWRNRRKDGTVFISRSQITGLEMGGKRYWVCVQEDFTDRKRAMDALHEEARILESINRIGQVLSAELDLQKLLQSLTDTATEISDAEFGSFFYNVVDEQGEAYVLYTLSGVPRAAFEGFPMPRNTQIFEPTFRGDGVVRLDDVTADSRFGQNPPYYGMPKGHLPVRSYLAVPVISRTGEVLGGLFFGHSQTGVFEERHERILTAIAAQAAIAIDNARLYQQARTAEAAASERARELAEADRRKDDFLAMLAHELRNPLGAASNAIHVMSLAPSESDAFHRAREVAVRQIAHQTHLVDDLLDVSRIARGKVQLNLEQLDLVPLVCDTVEDHRSTVETAGIQLALELPSTPVTVYGDRVRIAQVLANLLDNARKFTPAGGRVEVTLKRQRDHAVLSVKDSGIGIEAAVLPHLFSPFAQADRSLDRSRGGLGLGLALVKGLVELHAGGTVEARSEGLDCGSEFVVSLPLSAALPSSSGASTSPGSIAPRLRVLVIEDNRDAAETLRDLLVIYGCEVEVALTGQDGLQAARRFSPDVVLCDIGLPGGLSGYQVAQQLKALPETAGARLVAITGYGAEEDRQRGRQVGFDQHLTKPVQVQDLQRILTD